MTLAAGQLRDYVAIEYPTDTVDASGGQVTTWTKLADVWAKVTSLSGREIVSAGGITAEVTGRAYIRWRSDVTARMRLVVDGVIWSIVTEPLDKTGRREFLELLLTQGVNDG